MRVSGDNDTGGVFCSKNSLQETMFDFRLLYLIHEGTYDISSEYIEVYGSDYFNNYSGYSESTDSFDRGLNLSPGSELIGVGNVNLPR